jgi:hypothetical protein
MAVPRFGHVLPSRSRVLDLRDRRSRVLELRVLQILSMQIYKRKLLKK